MVTCVSESSYNIMFVMALIICIVLIFISAYFYNKFNKMEQEPASPESIRNGRTMAIISLVVIAIFIALLFLFFCLRDKMGAKLVHPANLAPSPSFGGSPQEQFMGPPKSMRYPLSPGELDI